jgi:hypothetical protein
MKYAVQMGLGAMTYISGFIKIGSGIQTLKGGMHDTQAWRSIKPTLRKQAKNGIIWCQIRAICMLLQYLALETLQKGLGWQSAAVHYHTEAEQLSEEVCDVFV